MPRFVSCPQWICYIAKQAFGYITPKEGSLSDVVKELDSDQKSLL